MGLINPTWIGFLCNLITLMPVQIKIINQSINRSEATTETLAPLPSSDFRTALHNAFSSLGPRLQHVEGGHPIFGAGLKGNSRRPPRAIELEHRELLTAVQLAAADTNLLSHHTASLAFDAIIRPPSLPNRDKTATIAQRLRMFAAGHFEDLFMDTPLASTNCHQPTSFDPSSIRIKQAEAKIAAGDLRAGHRRIMGHLPASSPEKSVAEVLRDKFPKAGSPIHPHQPAQPTPPTPGSLCVISPQPLIQLTLLCSVPLS